jgi:ribosomal protein S5
MRFKVFVVIGDFRLGAKGSKEVATSIWWAIILAKLSVVLVWRGYGGTRLASPTPFPCKVTGHYGSVLVCLIPASRALASC